MRRPKLVAPIALLVAGCGSSAPPAASPHGTVLGRVLSSPSCPVERAGSPCPPRPVSGAEVVAIEAGRVVATTHTDARGRFRLTVAPGRCTVRATNTGLASTATNVVTVVADQTAVIRMIVDSGIR